MQQKIAEAIGTKDAGIFDAHLLVVEDRTLIDEVLRKLEAEHVNVEAVFHEVATKYADTLSQIDDPARSIAYCQWLDEFGLWLSFHVSKIGASPIPLIVAT